MTKPLLAHAPRTVLHDTLAEVEHSFAALDEILPGLRRLEGTVPQVRRDLAHQAVAQLEITLEYLKGAAVRIDTVKALVRSATGG